MKRILFFFLNILIAFNFTLSASCERLENGCLICDPLNNLCFRCENEFLTPDNQGGCTGAKKCKLGYNYCEMCNSEHNFCEKCEEGYFQDNNGGCSYTDNCEISYKGECLKCKENYILVGIRKYYDTLKICKSLSSTDLKNCAEIDITDGLCLKCEKGYNITKGDKKCTNTENCFEMENGECISCIENYYLDKKQKKCIERNEKKFQNCKISLDGENCSKCDENYFLSDDLFCINTNYCSETKKDICIKCKDGFYLSKNNQCTNTKNCINADSKNGICIKCSEGYYLDINNRQCQPYSKNDKYTFCAKAKNNCIKCIEGYYIAENGLCSSSKNCSLVEEGKCVKCQENFLLSKNSKCIEKKHCIYVDDNNECIECEDHYYYDKLNKTCKIVESDTFKDCKFSDNLGEKCELCKSDFYINLSDNLCYSNKEHGQFYKCIISSGTGKNCTKCDNNFYLGYGDYKCTNTEGCFKSNKNNECQECEEDYCLNKKTSMCEWNYLIEEESQMIFFKCKKTNSDATACEQCEERFEVGDEGVCVNKIDCKEKKDGKCVKCKNVDEEGNFHCLNPLYGCVETYNSNCTKCDDNLNLLTHCSECQEGYELDENSNCILIKKEDD